MHVRSLWWYSRGWIGAGSIGGREFTGRKQGLSKLKVKRLNQGGGRRSGTVEKGAHNDLEGMLGNGGKEPKERNAGDAEELELTIYHYFTDAGGAIQGSPQDCGLGNWLDGNATYEGTKFRQRVWSQKPLWNY